MGKAAEQKRRQRERWRQEGWAQMTIRVPDGTQPLVKSYVKSLCAPPPLSCLGQLDFFEELQGGLMPIDEVFGADPKQTDDGGDD